MYNKKILFSLLLLFCAISLTNTAFSQNRKIVILKLDDVTAGGTEGVVPPRWQRVADYIENKKLKAGFGIIGFSLAEDNLAYFKWITDRAERGFIEFWNHGYYNRTKSDTIGEFEGTYEQQFKALQLTDSLAKAKLGLQLRVWGPHWSSTNTNTDKALAQFPQIKMTLGSPISPVYYKGYVLPNTLDMEYPVHNPNYDEFLKAYREKSKDLNYFYLQGHPNSWNENQWQNFVKIVEFLESENVKFVTPSEFLEIIKGK
ncbi:DUF2334 domain-containing protein [Dysgonomonas mossii]|uniref:DUF2334 domain-containing protein n=1 Tax=Dysgonomonas mossii TaxID=163665 RepID=UPI00399267AF